MLLLLCQEINRYLQGIIVGAIAVVNHRTIIDGFLQFHTHFNGRQAAHAFRNIRLFIAQQQHKGPAVHGVFNGCLIGERDSDR